VLLAAVEHGPVVGGQDIIEKGRIRPADGLTLAGLDRSKLQAALCYDRAQRPCTDPGKAHSGGDNEKKSEPERGRPTAVGGAVCGFGD